jgi:hypothetical protein
MNASDLMIILADLLDGDVRSLLAVALVIGMAGIVIALHGQSSPRRPGSCPIARMPEPGPAPSSTLPNRGANRRTSACHRALAMAERF